MCVFPKEGLQTQARRRSHVLDALAGAIFGRSDQVFAAYGHDNGMTHVYADSGYTKKTEDDSNKKKVSRV